MSVAGWFIRDYRPAYPPSLTHPAPDWVSEVPAFQVLNNVGAINLQRPITLFTGENGVGKSTLLEGIAVSCGFNSDGGAYGERVVERVNPLRNAAYPTMGTRAMQGYFLRAETHISLASEFQRNHERDFNAMSHGESVMHLVQEKFHGNGLFLLDEPESGLSFVRQMTLLAELHQIARAGAQLIIATHSPVLLSLPGARIYEFTAEGDVLRGIGVQETTAYRALRDFFADPHAIADFMVQAMEPD